MGYDIERFINVIDEEFICAICNGVLEEPLQIFPCEHIYCSLCLNQWFKSNDYTKTCPEDRQVIYDSFLKTPRIISNLLAKMIIKCKFCTSGCDGVIKLEQLASHESKCEYNPFMEIKCEKCNAVVLRNQLISHICDKSKFKLCLIL
jgi:hypothetical protein